MNQVIEVIKRPGLRLIVLESGETLRLPYALFRGKPLKAGLPLPENYLEKRMKLAPQAALEQAGRMLALRDHSVHEVQKKLLDQAYPSQVVEALIDRLCASGLLDDQRFCKEMVRRLGKKYGPRRVKTELYQKGIDQELIDATMEDLDTKEQYEAALKAAHKALKRRGPDPRMDARRAYAALARRGYGGKMAMDAVKQAMAQQEDEGADLLDDFMDDPAGF